MTQHRTREEQISALAGNLSGVRCIGAFERESARRHIEEAESRARAEAQAEIGDVYQRGVQNGREAGITIGRHQAQVVIAAAIRLAWSEAGTESVLNGGDPVAFDPWPEMDALLIALDQARPNWRSQTRMEGTQDAR
ncbi:hypothetical protein HLH34_04210 [Gluconacetobacter azotocaptans]|uniref:Uncharacterized protein n=1 Tax=Gluconacetobacter azotocaptans TaxID=142834 RepID=A0A7W4JQP3_9PROT|nr:hypothetical protein [Gluconacetobacter azotocaptans]MBB2189167.1 hypothetical protein [Gluconacetobacter azotocaptans]GBQ32126.1 hypothetical protein AA13594_2276 [Gluconacetobacter azotocaptans DSM 13594]